LNLLLVLAALGRTRLIKALGLQDNSADVPAIIPNRYTDV
jgi:hypothetical protein